MIEDQNAKIVEHHDERGMADLKVRKLVARYVEAHQPRTCVQPCHLIVYHITEEVVPFSDACPTEILPE
jgi:hypothetical protein